VHPLLHEDDLSLAGKKEKTLIIVLLASQI